MKGRRLYRIGAHLYEKGEGALTIYNHSIGDYWQEPSGKWLFHSPGGVIDLSTYEVAVHRDGTISVKPMMRTHYGAKKWSGYLTKGKWTHG